MSSSKTSKHHPSYVGDGTTGTAASPIPAADAPAIPAGAPAVPSEGGVGTVVFDSIGDARGDEWPPNEGVVAQSFSTASGSSTVTDVQLSLRTFDAGAGGTVSVELWSDDSTSPGTDLGTLGTIAAADLTGSFATYDFPVTGAPAMTADTRYWVEVTATVDNVEWGATFSASGTEVASEFQDTNGDVNPDGGEFGETFLMSVTTSPACFAAGTRIRTARGEIPVEMLREGDRVATAAGRLAPVRWIGRRRVTPPRHPRPWDVNPIRIRPGALAAGQPSRDLLLSPDHALFLDGMLIRARDLLNGATVVQESVEKIAYFHVELDRHDVLFAEGAPAESFLDTGNRAAFENGGAAVLAHPDFARAVWQHAACAELVWQGPALAAVRARLAARALQLGWSLTDRPDLRVIADGHAIRSAAAGGGLLFELAPGTATIKLRSRSTVPAYVLADNIDTRALGVAVTGLTLDGVPVPLDGPALGDGWLAPEARLRWTNGEAMLRVDGGRRLRIATADLHLPYWLPPAVTAAEASAIAAA